MSTPTPNLGNIITSAAARKVIYGVYAIAVVIIGAVQVAFASAPELGGQPTWLTVALAVAAYLGVPVSALALANTSTTPASTLNNFTYDAPVRVSESAESIANRLRRGDHA